MKETKYVALLRGINVGGNNIIKMDALKALFEGLNFSGVKTYIQSGNVIFTDREGSKIQVTEKIEKALSERLNSAVSVAVFTAPEIAEIISGKPKGFGEDAEHKYDVLFLIEPLKTNEAIQKIKIREGVDIVYEGKRVLYIARLIKELTKSYFPKIVGTPVYQNITIRNWNTTKKLYELMEDTFSNDSLAVNGDKEFGSL